MQLHDFLSGSGGAISAPTKAVKFKVVGKSNETGQLVTAEANAILVCVNEHERQQALRAARAEVLKQYPNGEIPSERLSDEETYQLLYASLRDSADPRVQFSQTVPELRAALTIQTAKDLLTTFLEFMEDEFPQQLNKAQFAELVEEAKSKSFAALLKSYDYSTVRRALPGLGYLFSK